MSPQRTWTILILLAAAALAGLGALQAVGAQAPAAQPAALTQPEAPSRPEIIRGIVASSVKVILGRQQQGALDDLQSSSGVVIYSEETPQPWSLVLTNAHAVSATNLPEGLGLYVSYLTQTGRRVLPAKVSACGNPKTVDLALVRVEGVALSPAQFEQMDQVQLGSPVLVASSPFGRELSITSGIVSQLYLSGPPAMETTCSRQEKFCLDPKPLEEIFKTDAPICYGSSGGGVFLASTGKLVGLVESYQTADIVFRPKPGEEYKIQIPVPGESFLISANKIKYFLEQNSLSLQGPKVLLSSQRDS